MKNEMEQTTNFINKEIEKTERCIRRLMDERKEITDNDVWDFKELETVDREISAYKDMAQTLRNVLNVMQNEKH